METIYCQFGIDEAHRFADAPYFAWSHVSMHARLIALTGRNRILMRRCRYVQVDDEFHDCSGHWKFT